MTTEKQREEQDITNFTVGMHVLWHAGGGKNLPDPEKGNDPHNPAKKKAVDGKIVED